MKLKFLFSLLLFSGFAFAQKQDKRLLGIDDDINHLLKAYNCAGLSLAIVDNDRVIYSKGFGYRDYKKKLAVTTNTIFPIGSITKSFTSSLLGIQEQKGQLSIKNKPSYYLPQLHFYEDKMDNLITIEDLLCHKSGIGNADATYIFFPSGNRVKLAERLRYIKPEGEIKNSWIYSNMGYIISAAVAEKITGQSWEQLVRQDIFLPLSMTSSSVSIADMFKSSDFSFGYGMSEGKIVKVLFEQLKDANPAGGINSNVSDMAQWIRIWLNKGSFNGKSILPDGYINEAMSIKAIDNGAPPEQEDPGVYTFGYGYGWKVNSYNGHYKVHHGGNISGFSSNLAFYPTDKIGVVVLTNQNNSILPYLITDIVSRRMLRLPTTAWDKYPIEVADVYTRTANTKSRNQDKKPTHDLVSYCGKYAHHGYGRFEIILEEGNLFAVFPDYKFRLEHQYYDIFKLTPVVEMSQYMNPEFYLNFSIDNGGDISGVGIDWQTEPVQFIKQDKK